METVLTPTETAPTTRAAIYCRISRDREGAGLGVDRQEADCRALAQRLGWEVVAQFTDNDISAYSGKHRPAYEQMLTAVRAGQVHAILAWHADRLHRRATELESFIAVVEQTGTQVQTVTAGELDLTTPSGRLVARQLGSVAQYEVEQTKKRIKAQKEAAAAAGKYRGGRRPYGYDKTGVRVVAKEADVIREACTAVLAGRSLHAIARDLNASGKQPRRVRDGTTVRPDWTYLSVRAMLLRPRNAGLISKGRSESPQMEIAGVATWPAIVDQETWRAVYALLTDTARRTSSKVEVTWLGSGIYICGLCGAAMRVTSTGGTPSRPQRRTEHYRCSASSHMTIHRARTDSFIRQQVADLVRDPRVVAAMGPVDDDDGAVAADRERRGVLMARLASFESDYAEGTISGTVLAKATARVNQQLDAIDDRLAAATRRAQSSPIATAHDPGQAFWDAPLDLQRAVLREVMAVEVIPAARKGAAWSSDRLLLSPTH